MRCTAHRIVLVAGLATTLLASGTVYAASWTVGIAGESGTPGGYVQVEETIKGNQINGTPLQLRSDLGISTVKNLKISATRRLGSAGALHLWLALTDLTGSGFLNRTAYFNGVTLAPGPISSNTTFKDFGRLQATYWRRIVGFGRGGGLWLSGGLTFVSLNFVINAKIAPDSIGYETKEDFNTQELPIPIFGIHLTYPLGRGFGIFGGIEGGHIPWTNSLRYEGGMVQLTQTNEDADLGLRYRFADGWTARLYLYAQHFQQHERSGQDNNYVQLNQHGFGIGITRSF